MTRAPSYRVLGHLVSGELSRICTIEFALQFEIIPGHFPAGMGGGDLEVIILGIQSLG